MLIPAVKYSHHLLKEIVQVGDTVIDATVGNGFDTLFLAELVGEQGHVFGLDIQEQAIQTTQEKVAQKKYTDRVSLYKKGHETVDEVIPQDVLIKGAIFNLGYLPKGDKSVITQSHTTLLAIEKMMAQLCPGGRIVIVVYYGHPGGEQEKNALSTFVEAIPQTHFNVLSYGFINQKNHPPFLLCIEKKTKVNAP